MSVKEIWKMFRNAVVEKATFWKTTVDNEGIKLSLRHASARVRFSLLTGYEDDDARLCKAYLTPEDRVLELGSSIGFIALYCMKKIGISHYAMIEANPALQSVMEENFKLNQVQQPIFMNVAAGPNDGEIGLNVSQDYYASSLHNIENIENIVTVKQMTIPSIIQQLDFKPNVLIMDIEGAETIIPMEHYYLFDKIIVEFHRRFVGDEAIDKIVKGLEENGFKQMAQDRFSSMFTRI